jgi:hypothetical protein
LNAGDDASKVLTPLSEWWRERGGGDCRKLVVHADHARSHKPPLFQQFMAHNAMVIAAHPPYSPVLAPSDFYRFGHVEGVFRGESFETGKQLLSAVKSIARCLEKSTLTRFFPTG